jgi:hypothetical protein
VCSTAIPRAVAASIAAATSLAAVASAASPPGLALAWEAPPACPDVGQVRAAIASMLDSPAKMDSANLVARATVTEEAPGRFAMRAVIEARGASETKLVDADSCATLAEAYAVIVAFRIDPSAASRAPAVARSSPLVAAPAHAPPPRSPPESRGGAGLRAAVGPAVTTGVGLLPFPSYGVGAAVAVEQSLRWELAATYWPAQPSWVTSSGLVDPSRTYGAKVQLASVQPSVCVPLARGVIGLCVGAQVGAMSADGTGSGVVRPDSGQSWWLAFLAGVALRWRPVEWLDVRVRVDGGVPVFRPTFVLENVGPHGPVEAYRPAPAFAMISLEPEVRFFSTESKEDRHVAP